MSPIKVIRFSIPREAYDMLKELCSEMECSEQDACEFAVFHLLGSWQHEKLEQGYEVKYADIEYVDRAAG